MSTTDWSRVRRAGRGSRTAVREILETYRPVVERFLLAKGVKPALADDITQEVCRTILQSNLLARADPAKGRFRNLLYKVTWNTLKDWRDNEKAKFRGGHVRMPESALEPAVETPEAWDREWVKQVYTEASARLAAERGQAAHDALMDHLMRRVPLAQIGARLGVTENAAKKMCARAKGRLDELAWKVAGEYCRSPEEHRTEISWLRRRVKGSGGSRVR